MPLRLATEADLPAIVSIYNAEVVSSTATWDTEPVSLEERRAWLRAHPPQRHPVLVLEEDGAVAAWGSLSPFSDRCGWAGTVVCSVYVAGERRGRGRGRLMLDGLCRRGTELGHRVAVALISADNAASLRMCMAEGFFEAGRLLGVGRKFDRSLDCALLQRYLRERAGAVVRDAQGRSLWIRREYNGDTWWILPGGGVEAGETPEQAAQRELLEETGLEVRLGPLGYRVLRHGRVQRYFAAEVARVAGPAGTGPEYDEARMHRRGRATPEWLMPSEIAARRCVPPPIAAALARGDAWPPSPVTLEDERVPVAARP